MPVRRCEQAEEVKARLAAWLAPRGLAFNEDKTRVVHLDEGCDFLGFNIRRYRGKLLTKPSNAALRRIRERLAAEVLALRGANADAVIAKLNPIIKGDIKLFGRSIKGRRAHLIARDGLAHVLEDRSLFFQLTVRENLQLGSAKGTRLCSLRASLRKRVTARSETCCAA